MPFLPEHLAVHAGIPGFLPRNFECGRAEPDPGRSVFLVASRRHLESTYPKWAQCPPNEFQEERMMKKTGAGLLLFCASIFLAGVCGAEEGMAVASSDPQAVSESSDFKAKAQLRMNELQSLSAEEIEKIVLQADLDLEQLNQQAQAARLAARELQEKARAENPEVQAKYREIDAMRLKINAFIDELPEVKAQLEVVKQAESKLMEEAWFRTAASALIAKKDRASGFPTRPEPVLDETKTESPAVSE